MCIRDRYNVGADFLLLNQELYGNVDAYIKDVKDMLISPAFLGAVGEGGSTWSNGQMCIRDSLGCCLTCKFLSVEVAHEVLCGRTSERTARIDVANEHPLVRCV